MFVSKKKYDALVHQCDILCMAADHWKAELDTLKASRARSNENLKLGTAASAKARRKKVGIDWSYNLEAYHIDGRSIPVKRKSEDSGWPDSGGQYHTDGKFDGFFGVWERDGTPWLGCQEGWRIRNVA